ncbi:MAG: MFS transporter [Fimbriimonadaceae bacterium]|nr:MFS transporter [Fimbriimonadaceae bacterium]
MEDRNDRRLDWVKLTWVIALFYFGFNVYNSVFQNFLRDNLHAVPLDLGRLESMREIPGLLASLMAGVLVALPERRIATIGLVICAVGIGSTGWFGSYWPLVSVTVFWSVGFHLMTSVQNAMTLHLAKGSEGGRHLGRMSGVGATSQIAALVMIVVVTNTLKATNSMSEGAYKVIFIVGGVAILAASLFCRSLSTEVGGGERQPVVFRREYWLYYVLSFLEGCRRQIFSIFAGFSLIFVYGMTVEKMVVLQLLNAAIIAVTAPRMGRLVDRIGEKKPLFWYAVGLVLVFVGYATTHSLAVLIALYLLDNVLFSFSVGFTTYLHRIVRPGDLTPSIAMGVTMNHVAAVSVPIVGAVLWTTSGNYQLPFAIGAGIALLTLFFNRFLPDGPPPLKTLSHEAA